MRRYFAYIRVSTIRQGERGSSLQEQRSAIEAYAKRNALNITAWFEERETAAKSGRQLFVKMLARLSRKEAEGVIIHKIDRSARNLRDWARLGELIDQGVDVQFVHDNLDLHSRGGRLSADIQAVVAADYIRNLRDEVKKGFYGRLKQGYYPLPAPIGYLNRGGGNKKELDPVEAPLVRQAFELYSSNTISLLDLRKELAARGLRTKNGEPIPLPSLSKMLHNPFYMGLIRIARTNEYFPGCHEPIVTKALFDRVQAVLAGKTHSKVITHDLAFRRFVKCKTCGRHLAGERKKGRYVYYRCYNASCRKSAVPERALHTALDDAIKVVRLSEEEIGDLRDFARELLADAEATIARARRETNLRLSKCEERLVSLTDALIDKHIEKDVFEERRLASLRERQALLDALAHPRMSQTPAKTVLEYLELPAIKEIHGKMTFPHEIRQIAETLSWNFVVDGNKPMIMLKSPYREIAKWRLSQNGGPSQGTLGTQVRYLLDILLGVAKASISDAIKADYDISPNRDSNEISLPIR